MTSLLKKQYMVYLSDTRIKIVSFDIFDTLAFRYCPKPVDLFLEIGRHPVALNYFSTPEAFQTFRIAAEKQAREQKKIGEEITLSEIYQQFKLPLNVAHQLLAHEIEMEYRFIFLNTDIIEWIDLALKHGKNVIFISDMYLSQSQIKHIVMSKLPNHAHIKHLYVSSEYNCTKTSGNLFQKVLSDHDLIPNALLHIGDHPFADVRMPSDLGIQTLHYLPDFYLQKALELERAYFKASALYNTHTKFRILSALNNPYTEESDRFFYTLGSFILGPLLWDFAHWLIDLQKKNALQQINCVMREGRIFQKCIRMIDPTINVNLLYASRKATFLPSFDFDDFEQNGLNFFTFRKMTVQSYYELLGLTIHDPFVLTHKDHVFDNGTRFSTNNQKLIFHITQEFKHNIETIRTTAQHKKQCFLEYLRTNKFTSNSLLVDFGGQGTILKNILSTLDTTDTKPTMALFYMHHKGFKKMLGEPIHSYLSSNIHTETSLSKIARSPEFLETLLNGFYTTTTGYVQNIHGMVEATTEPLQPWQESMKPYFDAFDKGVENFFETALSYQLPKQLLSHDDALNTLLRLIEVPSQTEASHLGLLLHDEGYGTPFAENIVNEKHKEALREIGLFESYKRHMSNFNFQLRNIPWVQGTIAQIDGDFLPSIKGLIQENQNTLAIRTIISTLMSNTIDTVCIYGAGELFDTLLVHLKQNHIHIQQVFDTRAAFKPFISNGYEVHPLDKSTIEVLKDQTIIVATVAFATDVTNLLSLYSIEASIPLNIINHTDGLVRIVPSIH